MTDEELKEYLIQVIGTHYSNYPSCVKWNLKVLYYDKRRGCSSDE